MRSFTKTFFFRFLVAGLLTSNLYGVEFIEPTLLDSQGHRLDDPDYDLIRELHDREQRGLSLYRSGKYTPAYEALAEPARHGLKNSQHGIALMHINGQSVEKNLLVGIALFGLAAESGNRKLEKEYAKLLKSIPEKYRSLVQAQRSYYIERYGMEAQGIVCSKVKRPNSNLSSLKCLKQPGVYQEYPWAP